MDILHDSIKQALVEGSDEYVKASAAQRVEGWLHINGRFAGYSAELR